ncbi:hypothetical protein B0T11DRAFT_338669 [Plectosphaerella cucumerina]|uniref:2EXR domain-containing protein n=1 Tax=Plectosphaerella cucumerina TaxID=40658 RepID=A0A8K0TDT2_9PEZI|nr:hypothetical protein B0T11DRAFT_338669 [Plectosphaerella cucumerina]
MTTSFPKFGLLPLEIRQRIWELSMERRRVPVGDFPVISDEWGAESGPRPPAVPPPAVLQACVESRSYLDRYYVKAFTIVSPPRYTWINFDMDTVCLRQRTVEKFTKDVLPIRYLSIDGISTEEYEGWIAYIDSCVPLLADLEIRPIHEPVEWWVRWEALMTLWYYNDHPKPFRTTIIGPADYQFVPELTQDNFAKVRRDHLRRQYTEKPENFLPGTEMWDSDDDECHPDWRHVPGCECPPEERWALRIA